MYFESFDPLKGERLQIMDKNSEIIRAELLPRIGDDTLLDIFKTMRFSRIIDTKTLQYQRQGRMLTYAPNLGQEATQVASIAATGQQDWMACSFRELGAWLYKKAPLEKLLLYWYGNEQGMNMPEDVKVLPVNVPIASQMQHAVGLAYASMYYDKNEVVISYVGDGGTSQGDFHEALNHASVLQSPNVFIIQNNQYAISTRKKSQYHAKTLAQRALAYDIPGIQVDGNDVFAVYAATKEAVDRAREGGGPSLIECYTYRMGAHTTSDDPKKYREDSEVDEWRDKDPIERLKTYLLTKELWSEEKDRELIAQYEKNVKETFEDIEKSEPVPLEEVFDYTYASRTPELERQYQTKKAYYQSQNQ